MKNNFALAEELDEQNKKFKDKDNFLGVDILTMANKVDAVRGTMLANMLQQAVCIDNAEPARLFTRYENQVGKYSSSYYRTPNNNLKVVAKISKSKNNYLLVLKNMKTGVYDVQERKIAEKLTESYCYLNNNEVIDTVKKGDIIPPRTVLHHSTNFDNYMNYSYGLNAKVCFMIHNKTIEDAIVASKSFAKRMSSNYLHEIAVTINTNDLLVNVYGDKDNYKSFPDIGEETKGKILTARRRINYDTALFDLKDEQLQTINYSSDSIFYGQGILVDIDIYSNTDIESLEENQYNEQIVKYLKAQTKYYEQVKKILGKIINGKKKCTDDLRYMYRRACETLDTEVKWKNDKTDFDNIIIVFKVLEKISLHVGSKISGRYGNKGVISEIVDDEDMPITENGVRAECILNPLGILNRLISAPLYEHELLFIADNIVEDMKKMKLSDAKRYFFEFLKEVNTVQYRETLKYYNKLTTDEKKEFLRDIMENGFHVHQPPFWNNINFEKLSNLYDKYDYKPYKVFIKGKECLNPIIISDMYMLKLKHEPSSKLSIRSTSFINMKNSPSKSLSFKKHEEPYSKTPIRIGEMELINLLLAKNSKIQAKFNSFYANNEINRKHIAKTFLSADDVLNVKSVESPVSNSDNGSKTLLNVLFKTVSIKLKEIKEKVSK